ncbi:MAG: DUF4337 domain-containing protein [Candidatus Omnitrophica bacterium]|nr:DUF4337 domain-containing protein [Candidatus Omnitrophota bacterium]
MADILQEKWMKGVAVTTTILAVVASISSSRAGYFVAKAQLLTALEGSKWAYYQAKSIKQNLAENQLSAFEVDILGSTSPEQRDLLDQKIKTLETNVARYGQEKETIKKEAEDTGMENGVVNRRGGQFSMSVVFAQIAIMMSSVGALIKRRDMWIIGLIIGVVAIVYLTNGFLLLF